MKKMAGVKKLRQPVSITTVLEVDQYEALRYMAYKEHRSLADLFRTAVEELIVRKSREYPIPGMASRGAPSKGSRKRSS